MTSTCRKCGGPVEQPGGRGRPRSYCSTGCRRAMEFELRRVQTALGDVEDQLRACRFGWFGRRGSDAPRFDAERLRLERRLRVLLDDEDVKA